MFKLNERIDNDTFEICDLPLCTVRLMNDEQYPWLILVPKIANVSELHQLEMTDQQQLLLEINQASQVIEDLFTPTKINIASLGNMVSQLHIHVIGRFDSDIAWPGPVWGQHPPCPYADEEIIHKLKVAFKHLQSRA
ncbi:HIT domain-containing protein [Terasakiella sp. SH-1]|uniref:HIT domain-containing protein n=1 Tax=Terasakiella sp. SH-1 TaxID=2560057 RepID=UPI00107474D8|nr:HIT domain-containing protein [Terasakiella sp. SH-1]